MKAKPARIIHRTIHRDWREVYAYASKPQHMAEWASGLATGLAPDGDTWVADGGPLGDIRIRFTPENDYGVIDHSVTLADGSVFENPMRVVGNGDGAEVMFTLYRQPDMDDAAYESDADHITRDLDTLSRILEGQSE